MSIDARVQTVVLDGGAGGPPGFLVLVDRPATRGGTPGIKGQRKLYFDSAPPWVCELTGKDIWGGSNSIIWKDQEIAVRDGYTRIRFTADKLHGLGPITADRVEQERA